jgi:hypothetical protein
MFIQLFGRCAADGFVSFLLTSFIKTIGWEEGMSYDGMKFVLHYYVRWLTQLLSLVVADSVENVPNDLWGNYLLCSGKYRSKYGDFGSRSLFLYVSMWWSKSPKYAAGSKKHVALKRRSVKYPHGGIATKLFVFSAL